MSLNKFETTGSVFTALTDNSGGTAVDTIVIASGTYAASEANANAASFAAKINEIISVLNKANGGG